MDIFFPREITNLTLSPSGWLERIFFFFFLKKENVSPFLKKLTNTWTNIGLQYLSVHDFHDYIALFKALTNDRSFTERDRKQAIPKGNSKVAIVKSIIGRPFLLRLVANSYSVFRNRASKRISMLARAWLAYCIIISGQPTTVYTLYSELPQVHCRRRNSNINVTCNRNSEPISNAIARALNLFPSSLPLLLFFFPLLVYVSKCIHGVTNVLTFSGKKFNGSFWRKK